MCPQDPHHLLPAQRDSPARPTFSQKLASFTSRLMSAFGWMGLVLALLFLLSLAPVISKIKAQFSVQLQSTSHSLRMAGSTFDERLAILDRMGDTFQRLHDFSAAVDASLASGRVLMDDLADFLGGPLRSTLESTEASLRNGSDGAAAIDSLLRILTRIPFLGGPDYDPAQPLDASLLQAADGLTPLRPALVGLQSDLKNFSGSTVELQAEFVKMDISLGRSEAELKNLRSELRSAADKLAAIADRLDRMRERLPIISWLAGLGLGLMAVWASLLNALLIREAERTLAASEATKVGSGNRV